MGQHTLTRSSMPASVHAHCVLLCSEPYLRLYKCQEFQTQHETSLDHTYIKNWIAKPCSRHLSQYSSTLYIRMCSGHYLRPYTCWNIKTLHEVSLVHIQIIQQFNCQARMLLCIHTIFLHAGTISKAVYMLGQSSMALNISKQFLEG